MLNQKRAKPATAETVDGLQDSEHAGGQLDPILTPADILEQVDRDIGVVGIGVLTDTGHWSRIQHEHLLIGVRGSVPAPTPGDQVASVIVSNDGMVADPRKEGIPLFLQGQNRRAGHSAKPAAFRALIKTMYPHLPRIELFARENVWGWDAWSNEMPGTLGPCHDPPAASPNGERAQEVSRFPAPEGQAGRGLLKSPSSST
jgi:hypothetical protein